jgi:hypothetical protein
MVREQQAWQERELEGRARTSLFAVTVWTSRPDRMLGASRSTRGWTAVNRQDRRQKMAQKRKSSRGSGSPKSRRTHVLKGLEKLLENGSLGKSGLKHWGGRG